MTTVSNNRKQMLRKEFSEKRKSLTTAFHRSASERICDKLLALEIMDEASVVAAYMSDGVEPNLRGFVQKMMERDVEFLFPRFKSDEGMTVYEMVKIQDLDEDFDQGAFNIFEPRKSIPTVDLPPDGRLVWLVPGVAFDRRRSRLGRGKSVYDRLLRNVPGFAIGVFYSCQETESVPVESHDMSLDLIVTELETI